MLVMLNLSFWTFANVHGRSLLFTLTARVRNKEIFLKVATKL